MVKKIVFTIFVLVRSFLHLLVHLFDCSFVHMFVCSGRVVSWSLVVGLFGCVVGTLFVRLLVCSFGCFFVCSCVREVDCSFGLLILCSCVLLFDLFISCLFRGSFHRSCLLLRNCPIFKVHLESAAAYRERSHKRHK